jgi:hypothetical protein
MSQKNNLRNLILAALSSAIIASSCSMNHDKPKSRHGSCPSIRIGNSFQDKRELGNHNSNLEGNGQVYCCKAGNIDLAHLRKAADWTLYLKEKSYAYLMDNKTEFSFNLKEPSKYFVKIRYPDRWQDLAKDEKEKISKDISIKIGSYFTHTATTWHEILTWFGYKSRWPFSEFHSAFCWEDTFSDNLGVYLAGKVLEGNNISNKPEFDKFMTSALERELEKLNIQPKEVARKASEKIKGKWYTGNYFFSNILKRNFDIGLDGNITPLFILGVSECEKAEAISYPVPNSDFSKYGFSVGLEIEPRVWEKNKILQVAGKKKRILFEDFPAIMDYIRQDAIKRYGPNVDSKE